MITAELTRRERKKEETKERIFRAAFGLFRAKGFDATTVEEICTAADVAKGTFFNYFPRKEAVLAHLAEQWQAEAAERAVLILGAPGPAWDKLLAMFTEFASFYEAERALARPLVQEWTRQLYAGDEVCQRWQELGEGVVRRLQAQGELRPDLDPARASALMQCAYHGTVQQWVESPEPPYPLKDELRKRLTLIMEGLAVRAPGGGR